MRRRMTDYRRPVRRRLWCWIWSILGLFTVAGLVLFVIHHNHNHDPVIKPSEEKNSSLNFSKEKQKTLNFREEMVSAISYSRQLSEQLTLAKAYIVIAKEHNNTHLAWQLSSNVQKCQLLLAKAAIRGEPIKLTEAEPIIKSLSSLIFKAQDTHYDIATTIVNLKSHIQALEARATAATVQSVVFGQMAAETLPKNLHCLILKLNADWVRERNLKKLEEEVKSSPRLIDNNLYHFCLFSDNVLGTAVVVNSTVCNAEHPKQLVFHIVTDSVSYGAMQSWFLGNDFKEATIEVQKIEELSLLHVSDSLKLTHLRFYIPEIYPQLEKVVFLDDDVVIQKELTSLFSLELHGNVNGAVETCLETFHRLYKYLNFSNPIISSKFDPQTCAWAFGVNVFDLIAWRKANVTARYHFWQHHNLDQTLWKLGTLPPALLAFYGLTEPLDKRWHVLGLGYDANIDHRLIESAAVVHFNGNMKPWLKLGISRYKPIWERYVNSSHPYLQDCVF